MAALTADQLMRKGFARVGENVQISDKASFYNCKKISICDNVRIDDFCILSAGRGGIEIGSYVHIGAYSMLTGAGKISLLDFSGLSSRVSIYSSSDDYSGASMSNPTVPAEFTNVHHADVIIGRHAIIGSGSVVLPGVILEQGVAVGALSLISKNCSEFGIYSGTPAKRIKTRKRDLLEKEAQLVKR